MREPGSLPTPGTQSGIANESLTGQVGTLITVEGSPIDAPAEMEYRLTF